MAVRLITTNHPRIRSARVIERDEKTALAMIKLGYARLFDDKKVVEPKEIKAVNTEAKVEEVEVKKEVVVEEKPQKIYKDDKGKRYTQQQIDRMDKRTALYKQIMILSKTSER